MIGGNSTFLSFLKRSSIVRLSLSDNVLGSNKYNFVQSSFFNLIYVPNVSDFCRMNKIMDYVYETIKYQPDWGLDYYQSPEETLKKGTGDCDDKAILYCSLARQVGLLCKVFSEKNHALTKVCFDDRCYIVDPTNSKIKGA